VGALEQFVLRYGYGLLFIVVFAEQIGAPVPAAPVLLVMGALAGLGHFSLLAALAVAAVAATAGDLVWYLLGRHKGESILGLLCRFSLEPDTCVRRTRGTFEQWGALTLLGAKFVPGLSTVAPPLAGSAGIPAGRFLGLDGAGSLLWAGAGLGAGYLFRYEAGRIAGRAAHLGLWAAILAGLALVGWIFWKAIRRERVMRELQVARITPSELAILMASGEPVVVVDLRGVGEIRRTGRKLPGAVVAGLDPALSLGDLPAGAHLVFYCT
jgi:membrane protein DedA with SNARE-associated domain